MRRLLLLAAASLALAAPAVAAPASPVGSKVDSLKLVGLDGKPAKLHDLKGHEAVVVVFLSFDCPVASSYAQPLSELAKDYGPRKIAFLGVLSTEDPAADLAKQAKDFGLTFPLYHDRDFSVARALEAKRVPEVFVLDREFTVRYRGRIDDGYSERFKRKPEVARRDLKVALDELLAGKPVSEPSTEAVGCPIQFPKELARTGKVTYHRDVLPILQNRCQSCHRPGEVAPFSLSTYKQAVRWADDIKDYTQSRKMPPWKPTEGLAFHDQRKMSDKEIATLADWVAGGTPEGDPKDGPPPPKFTQGWQLGTPDLILEPREDMVIAPTGGDVYRCYVFPTDLPEDKFVVGYEVRPGNTRVVHHTIHFLDTKGRARQREKRAQEQAKPTDPDRGPGYNSRMGPGFFPPDGDVGGWAPGLRPHYFAEGAGFYLPKGTDVVVQVHYHRTGREERDRTRVGLYFAKKPVDKPIQPIVVPGAFLVLPRGKDNIKVSGSIWLANDVTVHTVMPHMHLLGKSIKLTATPPGGETRTLITIKDWDYNWQEMYFLKEPLKLKTGTKLSVEAYYDNSDKNPNNPSNPPRDVYLGEGTTNEMCFGFLNVTNDEEGAVGFRLSQGGFLIRRPGLLPPKKEK